MIDELGGEARVGEIFLDLLCVLFVVRLLWGGGLAEQGRGCQKERTGGELSRKFADAQRDL